MAKRKKAAAAAPALQKTDLQPQMRVSGEQRLSSVSDTVLAKRPSVAPVSRSIEFSSESERRRVSIASGGERQPQQTAPMGKRQCGSILHTTRSGRL